MAAEKQSCGQYGRCDFKRCGNNVLCWFDLDICESVISGARILRELMRKKRD
jgi:hypothetical protein